MNLIRELIDSIPIISILSETTLLNEDSGFLFLRIIAFFQLVEPKIFSFSQKIKNSFRLFVRFELKRLPILNIRITTPISFVKEIKKNKKKKKMSETAEDKLR